MQNSIQQLAPPGLPIKKALRLLQVNEVRLAGRLTRDPEVRSAVGDKIIVHLNLALNRPYQSASGQGRQEVTYVPVTVWNRLATDCTRRLAKGSAVYIEGRLRSDQWKNEKGEIRTALKVEASKMRFLSVQKSKPCASDH